MKKILACIALFASFGANAGVVPCDKNSYEAAKNIANANGYSWTSSLAQCKADENVGYVLIYPNYAERGSPNALFVIFKSNPLRLQYKRGTFDAFCAVLINGNWTNTGKTCS